MATLEHWLSTLVIALVTIANGISCNNGLAAVLASHMGLAHWSAVNWSAVDWSAVDWSAHCSVH